MGNNRTTQEYNFEVYSLGIVHASVCTNLPKNKLSEHMGEHEPTGIDSPWEVSKDNFRSGEKNGFNCPDKPGNRHWLMEC